MSHVTTIDIEVRDLDALSAACDRLRLRLDRDVKTFRNFMGRQSPCDHTITVIGAEETAYQIGVVKLQDRPGFTLQWDSWNGGKGLVAVVGENCSRLKQEYAAVITRRELQRQGCQVSERRLANSQIVVTGRRA